MSQFVKPLQFVEVIILLVIAVLAWPITVTCNAPNQTCSPPPNEKGEIIRPITVKPHLVVILENLLKTDVAISYKTGTKVERPVLLPELDNATPSASISPEEKID